ncbi:MAG: N-acetylmuramoyl-L-alanine amidase [Synechococcus sp. SupBloom_Metag_053]|nr:N-acetylmuramoyl-L-alanine amidase [Synechococcus sp. SupBloom_Metag_053]
MLSATPELSKKCKQILNLREIWQPADKTNYGLRRSKDLADGRIPNQPSVIVLHETVLPLDPTLKLFSTPHPNDNQQLSYHLILARDGSLYRIVADEFRAYGAGWSAWGDSTIRHRGSKIPAAAGSINNVALHISLVSPLDGGGNTDGHSGYSNQQYSQLAQQVLLWQLRWGIPMRRVTTHASVDRSHSRSDPRSFRWHLFDRAWQIAAKRCNVNASYSIDARSR